MVLRSSLIIIVSSCFRRGVRRDVRFFWSMEAKQPSTGHTTSPVCPLGMLILYVLSPRSGGSACAAAILSITGSGGTYVFLPFLHLSLFWWTGMLCLLTLVCVTTEKVSFCHQNLYFDFVCEQMEKRRHLMWKDRRWAWNKFKAIFLSPVSSLLYHYKYLYVVSQFKKYEGWILLHERVVSTRKNWMTNVCYNIDY